MRHKHTSRLVYSTDTGRRCPDCQRPVAECNCRRSTPAGPGDGIVRLRRETKGRGGKAVTVITGLGLADVALKELAKALKQRCGVGGAIKGDNIELQGDHRAVLQPELEKRGFTVKIAGG